MQLKYEIDALLNIIIIIINNHTGKIKRKNSTKIKMDMSPTPASLLDWSRMIILKPR